MEKRENAESSQKSSASESDTFKSNSLFDWDELTRTLLQQPRNLCADSEHNVSREKEKLELEELHVDDDDDDDDDDDEMQSEARAGKSNSKNDNWEFDDTLMYIKHRVSVQNFEIEQLHNLLEQLRNSCADSEHNVSREKEKLKELHVDDDVDDDDDDEMQSKARAGKSNSKNDNWELDDSLMNITQHLARVQKFEEILFGTAIQTKAITQNDSLPKEPECILYDEARARSPVRSPSNLEKIFESLNEDDERPVLENEAQGSGPSVRASIEEDAKHESSIIRKFMLTIKDKNVYEYVIRDLGGDVSTSAHFDNSATHLLCKKLIKNEKTLNSIAAGKWVLHFSYLHDSKKEGRFLDEEEYEWGNPKSKRKISKPKSVNENAIAAAAYRWRWKLQSELDGPFSDIVAILMISDEKKYNQFKRLIVVGGGSVMQTRPPYDAIPSGTTYCFIDAEDLKQPIDWVLLAKKGILCFSLQYLNDYLLATTPPNPRDCVLAEFKRYLTLLPK